MFRIIYGCFTQETNTFSPIICRREYFEASGISKGEEVLRRFCGRKAYPSGILNYLTDAEDTEVIPTAAYMSQSCGRVDQAVCDEFLDIVLKTMKENEPYDGIFLTLHGGMCTTVYDDGIGEMLERIRAAAGPDVLIAASTDLHANITKKVIRNLDILTGFHEYPHTDTYNTGLRAAKLGMEALRSGKRPAMACVKLPMILQAEASSTKSGPLYDLVQSAEKRAEAGAFKDFTVYHMQPWLDIEEAGASVVVIADDPQTAKKEAEDIGRKYFDLRHVLKHRPITVDEGLDLCIGHRTGELVVLSDAADNPSGGATGDSVEVLRRILERKLDIRAAMIVADPEAAKEAEALGEGASAVLTIGGKIDPRFYRPVTHEATVVKVLDPVFGPGAPSFGRAVLIRMRNTDIILVQYPQYNFSKEQFTGFGLRLEDYDMVQVKSSLAYVDSFKDVTSRMYNVDTPGSCTPDLVSLGFTRIPRPMYPFDDPDDLRPAPPVLHADLLPAAR